MADDQHSASAGASDGLYDSYVAYKKWDVPAAPTEDISLLFANARLEVSPATRVLEIGFGQGGILDWLKLKGAETHGVEIIDALMEEARARGHSVHRGPLNDALLAGGPRFTLFIAFDLLEHLAPSEIEATLRTCAGLAEQGAHFLARFPNGESPFYGGQQHGDLTHRVSLTEAAILQLAARTGWRQARPVSTRTYPKGFVRRLKRWTAFRLRDLIETAAGFAYYGRRVDFSPEKVVLLVREPAAAA